MNEQPFPPPIHEGGHLPEGGTSARYLTGGWASKQPRHDREKCVSCLLCWIYCPDGAIIVENQKVVGINYDYCKGCGICVKECPPKTGAMSMPEE